MSGAPVDIGPAPHLTRREMEVVVLLCSAECLLEKEMPDRLGVSLSTFKTHKEHVFSKCQVNGRLQLIHKAVQWRWVVCACGAQGAQAAALPLPLPMDGPPVGDPVGVEADAEGNVAEDGPATDQ